MKKNLLTDYQIKIMIYENKITELRKENKELKLRLSGVDRVDIILGREIDGEMLSSNFTIKE